MASLGRYLLEIPWDAVLSENKSCDDKLAALTQVIDARNYCTLFKQIIESDGQHKLAGLLPARNDN